ncbi:MAG: hypothetical protein HRU03_08835 [Nanoarchaeales archaeon]|nr:hypothetical protein [Nanoarchaeales archaeon]
MELLKGGMISKFFMKNYSASDLSDFKKNEDKLSSGSLGTNVILLGSYDIECFGKLNLDVEDTLMQKLKCYRSKEEIKTYMTANMFNRVWSVKERNKSDSNFIRTIENVKLTRMLDELFIIDVNVTDIPKQDGDLEELEQRIWMPSYS